MERAIRTIVMLAVLLAAVPGVAAEGEGEAKTAPGTGFYGAMGVSPQLPAFDLPSDVGQQASWGLDARAGYRIHSRIALEGQFQWASRFELTQGGAQLDKLTTYTGTTNAKIFILNGPLEPYAILGVGVVNAQFKNAKDHTAAAFRVGGGFHVFFTEHIGAYAEITYLKPFTSLNDYNTVPLAFGGIFQF
jgi:opacity protein-like surface antigen